MAGEPGNTAVSAMKKLGTPVSDASFSNFGDRMSFVMQAIIARKFSDNLSVALSPAYVRRNLVSFSDMNNLFALGIGGRMKFSKRMAIVVDYFISFRKRSGIWRKIK